MAVKKTIYVVSGYHYHYAEDEHDIITNVFTSRKDAAKFILDTLTDTFSFPDDSKIFTIDGCMYGNNYCDLNEEVNLKIEKCSILIKGNKPMYETVYDFLDKFCDSDKQQVAIFDLAKCNEIYRGTRDKMPSDIQELEILSIDTLHVATTVLTLNVDTSIYTKN